MTCHINIIWELFGLVMLLFSSRWYCIICDSHNIISFLHHCRLATNIPRYGHTLIGPDNMQDPAHSSALCCSHDLNGALAHRNIRYQKPCCLLVDVKYAPQSLNDAISTCIFLWAHSLLCTDVQCLQHGVLTGQGPREQTVRLTFRFIKSDYLKNVR